MLGHSIEWGKDDDFVYPPAWTRPAWLDALVSDINKLDRRALRRCWVELSPALAAEYREVLSVMWARRVSQHDPLFIRGLQVKVRRETTAAVLVDPLNLQPSI